MIFLADLKTGQVGRAPHPSWADLRLRVLSALVLAPVSLLCVWLGGLAWLALLGAVVVGLAVEWLQLCRPRRNFTLIAPVGLLYFCCVGASLIWLRRDPVSGLANLLCVLLLVWATDIGAYLVGRWLGGPKLAPSISPGKTWSGAVGGLVAAILLGLAGIALAGGPLSVRAVLVLGGLSLVSQAGDLTESALKRHFGVKDSGRLIPGHGGLLDRLDGVLAAAPVAALLALGLGPGVPLWQ